MKTLNLRIGGFSYIAGFLGISCFDQSGVIKTMREDNKVKGTTGF